MYFRNHGRFLPDCTAQHHTGRRKNVKYHESLKCSWRFVLASHRGDRMLGATERYPHGMRLQRVGALAVSRRVASRCGASRRVPFAQSDVSPVRETVTFCSAACPSAITCWLCLVSRFFCVVCRHPLLTSGC
jgi:hypothetical protein